MIALTGIPTLQTERLILRVPKPSDAAAFMAFYTTNRSHMAGGPLTGKQSWQAFAADFGHWALRGFGRFIVTLKGSDTPVGLVGHYAPHPRPENEIGWVLFAESHEGRGIAFEAARACVDHAWQALKWDTIVSYIAIGNTSSIHLAERLGAVIDPEAPQPKPEQPCLVFRHPRPEVLR